MAIWGLDLNAISELTTKLDREADAINSTMTGLNASLNQVEWRGPDADRFRQTWQSTTMPQVRSAVSGIRNAAAETRANAEAQARASALTQPRVRNA